MSDIRRIDNPFVVKVSREFNTTRERVFDAWLDGDNIGKWLFASSDGVVKEVSCDPRVGGGFVVADQRGDELARHVATYHEIDRPQRLVFSYYFDAGEEKVTSNVYIDFSETEKGCILSLTHEMDDIYAEYEESAIQGWNMILAGLAKTIA